MTNAFDWLAVFVGVIGSLLHPDFAFLQSSDFGHAQVKIDVETFHEGGGRGIRDDPHFT